MAQQDNSVPGTGSGNTYIDSLIWGCGWDMTDGPITVHFGEGEIPDIPGTFGLVWTQDEIDAFVVVFDNYEAVCGLDFEIVDTNAEADMVEWKLDQSFFEPDVLGVARSSRRDLRADLRLLQQRRLRLGQLYARQRCLLHAAARARPRGRTCAPARWRRRRRRHDLPGCHRPVQHRRQRAQPGHLDDHVLQSRLGRRSAPARRRSTERPRR